MSVKIPVNTLIFYPLCRDLHRSSLYNHKNVYLNLYINVKLENIYICPDFVYNNSECKKYRRGI